MANRIVVKSLKETEAFARKVADGLRGGEVLALTGELGSGKTAFTKSLAKALGIRSTVQSPTFLLMKAYSAKPRAKGRPVRTLCHVDAYRLKDGRELVAIGFLEHMDDPRTVTVIEWADRVEGIVPAHALRFGFGYGRSEGERIITVSKKR